MFLRTLYFLSKLRRSQWLKSSDLEKMQRKRMRGILKYAYDNVPFYHRKFDSSNVKPGDIKTVEDLRKMPITTRSEVQSVSATTMISKRFDPNRCIKRNTGGSSGQPLTVFWTGKTRDFDAALWNRAYLDNGYELTDKMALIKDPYASPPNRSWFQLLGFMNKRAISIFDRVEEQISAIQQFEPTVLQGYPSALTLIALTVQNRGIRSIHPRLIFTVAELLDKHSRKLLSSVFDAKVFSLYATHEFGLQAWECDEHMFHINTENVVLEFVRNGENVSQGENGEIVCTGLVNRAMPLIRYSLGDVGTKGDTECPCGRGLPVMKVLEGRCDDFLVTMDGRSISPLIFLPYPFESLTGIKQLKVIQEALDKITINLVVGDGFPENRTPVWERATQQMRKIFGDNLEVDFVVVEEIPRDAAGKMRKVVSRIATGMNNS